ncbi:hypothetical protein EV426DRAFT_578948 [Tirmania nivea]|nr:hypothetical protein EV426DRAFT_578948 [Tirmania nivea]
MFDINLLSKDSSDRSNAKSEIIEIVGSLSMLEEDITSSNIYNDSTDNTLSSDQTFREVSPGDHTNDVPNFDLSFREASPNDHTDDTSMADQSFIERLAIMQKNNLALVLVPSRTAP